MKLMCCINMLRHRYNHLYLDPPIISLQYPITILYETNPTVKHVNTCSCIPIYTTVIWPSIYDLLYSFLSNSDWATKWSRRMFIITGTKCIEFTNRIHPKRISVYAYSTQTLIWLYFSGSVQESVRPKVNNTPPPPLPQSSIC